MFSLTSKLFIRSLIAMGGLHMLQSPESATLFVGFTKTTLTYLGWVLISTMST